MVFVTITASHSPSTTEMMTVDPVMATVLNRGCYSVNLNREYYGLCNNNGKPFSIYDRGVDSWSSNGSCRHLKMWVWKLQKDLERQKLR